MVDPVNPIGSGPPAVPAVYRRQLEPDERDQRRRERDKKRRRRRPVPPRTPAPPPAGGIDVRG